ncbi:hypothetical protein C8J56DRAFT_801092 [Mycena floridula]|nr:hypothetical protein C8J56DRAFT_801092 [Mycena floridula]
MARCLRSCHSVILAGDATEMIIRLTDKAHTYQLLCPCSYCHKDRVQKLCPHPHKCTALALENSMASRRNGIQEFPTMKMTAD